jgi:hypothetical protein
MNKEREARRLLSITSDSVSGFSESLKPSRILALTGLLLVASAAPVDAQQSYCLNLSSGEEVRAGATVKQGNQLLRCCRMAPISGVPSNAAFLKEEQFKRVLNPHRCWGAGLRTRDFVAAKIPDHPRRGRRLGR